MKMFIVLTSISLAAMLPMLGQAAEARGGHRAGHHGTRSPAVNHRQQHQRQRIGQGVRSGELTRPEARGLVKEQRDIRQLKREYKSDGVLTRAERRDLHREQNQASRHIYRQKHDGDKR